MHEKDRPTIIELEKHKLGDIKSPRTPCWQPQWKHLCVPCSGAHEEFMAGHAIEALNCGDDQAIDADTLAVQAKDKNVDRV